MGNALPPPTGECHQTVIVHDGERASASSCESSSSCKSSRLSPDKAIDGDAMTRWGSAFNDKEWFALDLGEPTLITAVWLHWEDAYAKDYKLQVAVGDVQPSSESEQWNAIDIITDGDGGSVIHDDHLDVVAQYVLVWSTKRARERYGYSLLEVEVRGTKDDACFPILVSP
jgi:hypothetical protein